jgi:hypothetical protein
METIEPQNVRVAIVRVKLFGSSLALLPCRFMGKLHPMCRSFPVLFLLFLILISPDELRAQSDVATFFEGRIRPVLAENCYECHNSSGKKKGGLALDFRDGMLTGGESGSVFADGLLLKVIQHELPDLKMPKAGAKLAPEVIADFEKWIADGAYDPRDEAPSADALAAETSWEVIREGRKQWWSFQPVQRPAGDGLTIDSLLRAKMDEAELKPRGRADRATVFRRLKFVLTGLPPEPEEMRAFVADSSANAVRAAAVRMLGTKAYAERWARHWMDWLRYAESHGSEGDPAIPYASKYRDYLIRALEADVPYDQLMREHLAGDLMAQPRVSGGINESAMGTAQLRMVFHGFAPTDALDEQVRFTDDQIDVVTKAFMGLTVSCARCHNHKFDAISQKDFYALYGIFASCRPGIIDARSGHESIEEKMRESKELIKGLLVKRWKAQRMEKDPFGLIERLKAAPDFSAQWETERQSAVAEKSEAYDFSKWRGMGVDEMPSVAGAFALHEAGEKIVRGIFPRGMYSHLLSTKQGANVGSERLFLDGHQKLYVKIAGDGQSIARYVVQNYPRNGTVYPVTDLKDGNWRWQQWDLDYWDGDSIHFELTTAADSAVLAKTNVARSWFGVRDVKLINEGDRAPADKPNEAMAALFEKAAPTSVTDVERLLNEVLDECVVAWSLGTMTDAQALFLDKCVAAGVLSNEVGDLAQALKTFRDLEASLPAPERVPGVIEGEIFDQPMFERGDHKKPLEPVARGFLEAFGESVYPKAESGRKQLAEDILRTPLAARVIVNRLWHHVFGAGLVPTTDNFGKLGDEPTHPELLDFLADEMVKRGWSMKSLLLDLVTSEAFQRESGGDEREEKWLASWRSRRLEAEAIRDGILAVSGQIGAKPRSVYLRVIRNDLDPFLSAFDAPEPLSTRGRRDVTNVPAQSLALMNDSFVSEAASEWVRSLAGNSDEEKVARMLVAAFGREPKAGEVAAAVAYVNDNRLMNEKVSAVREDRQSRMAELRAQLETIEKPVRERLAAGSTSEPLDLKPMAAWEFDGDLKDSVGGLHATAQGARVEDGTLVLDGKSHAVTGALPKELEAKTLEVLVQLDGLNQAGGGAISVQTTNGGVFDAIVFGEKDPQQWMAGSNGFSRTQSFSGPKELANEPVHVAIVYSKDGTIQGYRNGMPYGNAYRPGKLRSYRAEESNVLFGLRHSPAVPGRLLKGRIYRAALYDRALSEAEVAVAAGAKGIVTNAQIVAELGESEILKREALLREISTLAEAEDEVTTDPWQDLALAIFNMKEFIYLR